MIHYVWTAAVASDVLSGGLCLRRAPLTPRVVWPRAQESHRTGSRALSDPSEVNRTTRKVGGEVRRRETPPIGSTTGSGGIVGGGGGAG